MSLALYRKYRPSIFADVIGQEHVTTEVAVKHLALALWLDL
jgi:DNA polymerase-3 subunit gamma/tau